MSHDLEDLKLALIVRAVRRCGTITLCSNRTLANSFLEYNGVLQFWFNDRNGSTMIEKELIRDAG